MQAARQTTLDWTDDLTHLWEPSPAERDRPATLPPARVTRLPRPREQALGVTLAVRLAAAGAAGLVLVLLAMAVAGWARGAWDDLRYGRPRATHLTAFVGHQEAEGLPTHLMAVNLHRRIAIVEFPGGDPSRVRTIAGPYLVGKDEELTVATMRLLDVNGDNHPDLLVRVKNEEVVYINDRGDFRLMTRSERPVVERSLEAGK